MSDQKTKVFFIADKWVNGNQRFGLSEWEGNLWASLKVLYLAEVDVFHLDDYHRLWKQRGDVALLEKIEEFQPDIICLITNKMPGSDVNVPEWSTFDRIKNVLKIPLIAIWGDLEHPEQLNITKAMLPYVKYHVATASAAIVARIRHPEKYLYMWVPKNPLVFFDSGQQRDIDLSYIGSPKKDRLARVKYLVSHGVSVIHTGGERGGVHLKTMDYAELFRKSKITLSFSRAVFCHVINARPFEAMLCGAMVLEEESFETPKLYTPFVDYVPYFSNKDLLEKARYYLMHDEERAMIAHNGHLKTEKLYSAERFWRLLIARALDITTSDPWGRELPRLANVDLSRLSSWQCRKLMMQDLFSTSPPIHWIWFNVNCIVSRVWWKDRINRFLLKTLPSDAYAFLWKLKRILFNI